MFIQCTASLRKKLGLKEEDLSQGEVYGKYPDTFRAWHANLVRYHGKQSIILMNDETRYGVLLYGLKAKDFKNLKQLIFLGIRTALEMEGVRLEVIDTYLQEDWGMTFGKTKDRKRVARMNRTAEEMYVYDRALEEDRIIQKKISRATNRIITGTGLYPYEMMLKNLHYFDPYKKKSVVETPLCHLRIQMELEGHEIYRRVAVPGLFSFRHLHEIIRIAFDWKDSHHHLFEIDHGDGRPIQIVVYDDPETLFSFNEGTHELLIDDRTYLQEMFHRFSKVKYTNDFGDRWVHSIQLEKITMTEQLEAEYLGGNGERPPENIGGELGFQRPLNSDELKMKIRRVYL